MTRFRDLSESKQDQSAVELYEREVRGANTISPWCTLEPLDQPQDRFCSSLELMVGQMIGMRRQDMNALCENPGVEVRIGSQLLGLVNSLWKVGSPEDFQKEEVVVGMALYQSPRLLDFDESQLELLELEKRHGAAEREITGPGLTRNRWGGDPLENRKQLKDPP